jgi:hypothetical protein
MDPLCFVLNPERSQVARGRVITARNEAQGSEIGDLIDELNAPVYRGGGAQLA